MCVCICVSIRDICEFLVMEFLLDKFLLENNKGIERIESFSDSLSLVS